MLRQPNTCPRSLAVAESLAPERTYEEEQTVPEGLLALIGSVSSGRGDMAERHDDYIRERLQRRHSRPA